MHHIIRTLAVALTASAVVYAIQTPKLERTERANETLRAGIQTLARERATGKLVTEQEAKLLAASIVEHLEALDPAPDSPRDQRSKLVFEIIWFSH